LLLAGGCVFTWRRAPLPEPPAAHSRSQPFHHDVRIYSDTQLFEWRKVRLTHDSITGVPVDKGRWCESCRRGVARTAVDSLWIHDYSVLAKSVRFVAGLVAFAYAYYLLVKERLTMAGRSTMRVLVCFALVATGCDANHTYNWHAKSVLEPQPIATSQDVQVWTHGHALYWQQVVIGTDSISGVPTTSKNHWGWGGYTERDKNGCKKCRRGLPLSEVDSIRVRGGQTDASWLGVTAVVAAILYLEVVCGEHGGPHCVFGTYQ
jgi:hypothetical protein